MVCPHHLCILFQYNQLVHLQLCIDNQHNLQLCSLGEYNHMEYLQLCIQRCRQPEAEPEVVVVVVMALVVVVMALVVVVMAPAKLVPYNQHMGYLQLCILVQYNQLEHLQLCIDNQHMVCSHHLCILFQYNQLVHLQLCIDNQYNLQLCSLVQYNHHMEHLQLCSFVQYNHHME